MFSGKREEKKKIRNHHFECRYVHTWKTLLTACEPLDSITICQAPLAVCLVLSEYVLWLLRQALESPYLEFLIVPIHSGFIQIFRVHKSPPSMQVEETPSLQAGWVVWALGPLRTANLTWLHQWKVIYHRNLGSSDLIVRIVMIGVTNLQRAAKCTTLLALRPRRSHEEDILRSQPISKDSTKAKHNPRSWSHR